MDRILNHIGGIVYYRKIPVNNKIWYRSEMFSSNPEWLGKYWLIQI